MAEFNYLETLLTRFPTEQRRDLVAVFRYLLRSWQIGVPVANTRAKNLQQVFVAGTTAATPNAEFVIAHGLETVPYLVIPILPVGESGAKVVNLTVTRAADARYVYLSSPEASAPIWLLVEGGST